MTLSAASLAPAAAEPRSPGDPRLAEASRALEAMLIKQIVTSSGAFKGGDSPGSSIRADLFASTLADAVSQSGGLGLADQIMRSVSPGGAAALPPAPVPSASTHVTSLHAPPARPEADELPVTGRVTSGYGVRLDPLTGRPSDHTGLDVGAPEGTPIRAPAGGVVRAAGPRGGYGNAVEIDHGNGVVTVYGHARELLVVPGETVEPGQEIATVGATGRATGPHLHFEVRVAGRPVDPSVALKKYGLRAEGSHGSGP